MSQYSDGKKTDIPMGPAGGYGSNQKVTRGAEDILTNKEDWKQKRKTAQANLDNAKSNFPLDESLSPERTLTK